MKIYDGTYFVIEKVEGDTVSARCTKCNKIRKGNLLSSGNMITHYRKTHPSCLLELLAYLKAKSTTEIQKKPQQLTLRDSIKRCTTEEVSSAR